MKKADQSDRDGYEPMPKEHISLRVKKTYSIGELKKIRLGVIPQQMEDKWFIYFEDNKLYCHRSWTGFCIYIAEFSVNKTDCSINNIIVNRDREQYSESDNSYDCKLLFYLIDLLLLKKMSEYPLKEDLDSDEQIMSQWSNVGRAMFDENE